MEVSSGGTPPSQSSVVSRIIARPVFIALILGIVGLALFLAGIGRPAGMVYDEGFFVPEARMLLPPVGDQV